MLAKNKTWHFGALLPATGTGVFWAWTRISNISKGKRNKKLHHLHSQHLLCSSKAGDHLESNWPEPWSEDLLAFVKSLDGSFPLLMLKPQHSCEVRRVSLGAAGKEELLQPQDLLYVLPTWVSRLQVFRLTLRETTSHQSSVIHRFCYDSFTSQERTSK